MTALLNLLRRLAFFIPRAILVGIFMFALFVTVLSNFDLFEPFLPPLHLVSGPVRQISARVVAGPYPHVEEMARMKMKGVRVIYSLLDPGLPQEKALLERELKNAAMIGLEVRNFPMGYLPVNSERNRQTRGAILASLTREKSEVYLHCYLGRHRVTFVSDAVQDAVKRLKK